MSKTIEEQIKFIAEVVRDQYVDETKANIVYDRMIEFLDTPIYQQYKKNKIIWTVISAINCIFQTYTADPHMYIASTEGAPGTYYCVDKFTPHYINVRYFNPIWDEETRKQLQYVLSQIQDRVVIDLRGCPGGDPETVLFMLSHFFPDGKEMFGFVFRKKEPLVYKSQSVFPTFSTFNTVKKFTGDVKILVNGYSASGSEIFAHVIQSNGRGKIYGSNTMGITNLTFNIYTENLKVGVPFAKCIDPKTGENIEAGGGVVPDYSVETKEYINLLFNELDAFVPMNLKFEK